MKLGFAPLFKTAALSCFLLAAQYCFATEYASGDLRFKKEIYRQSGPKDEINRIHLEKITMQASRRLGKNQAMRINKEIDKLYEATYLNTRSANKINAQLKQLSASFYAKSRQCNTPPKNIPWGYEFELLEATDSGDTLTIVFDATSACAGRHSFKKVIRNFSIQTGALIPED